MKSVHARRLPGVVSAMLPARGGTVCQPRLVSVELPKDNDPSVYNYPLCVALHQCGGCCGGTMFECHPTVTEEKHMKVSIFSYNPNIAFRAVFVSDGANFPPLFSGPHYPLLIPNRVTPPSFSTAHCVLRYFNHHMKRPYFRPDTLILKDSAELC